MQARFITLEQLETAARETNVRVDVRGLNDKGDRHRVKVNPSHDKDSDGNRPYQRISASMFSNERRVAAVCWHGFRDFFRACFELAPNAVFRTAMDTWSGSEDFEKRFHASGHKNIGSQMAPMYACDACVCPDRGIAA